MFRAAKSSITSWWILALISLFLWYRNQNYDRALATFVFTLGLIQLIEYGIHSGTDPSQSGRTLFITLWLQCLVLAIGVYIFINDIHDTDHSTMTQNVIHTIAGWNLMLFSIVFVVCLIMTFMSQNSFYAAPNYQQPHSDTIEWHFNNRPTLDQWGWLYLIGIFVPLILIFGYYMWADIGIATLIIYGIVALAYILTQYPLSISGTTWSYLSVGFAFLAWFIGVLPSSTTNNIQPNKDLDAITSV